jgi:hypothetical protein
MLKLNHEKTASATRAARPVEDKLLQRQALHWVNPCNRVHSNKTQYRPRGSGAPPQCPGHAKAGHSRQAICPHEAIGKPCPFRTNPSPLRRC